MTKWEECRDSVRQYIKEQTLTEGALLPSDREFANKLGCSLQPVIRAMHELARSGEIRRCQGARASVLSPLPRYSAHGFSFGASAEKLGHGVATRVLEVGARLPRKDSYQPRRLG